MVVYDDMAAGLGAQQYLDRITGRVGDVQALDVRYWKEDILSEPHLWDQASADAAEVDLILFAVTSSVILPTRIVRWVQKWQQALEGQEVSFALLTSEECENHSLVKMVRRFLKQTAQSYETRFFKGSLPNLFGNLRSAPRRSSTPGAETSPALNHRRGGCRNERAIPGR